MSETLAPEASPLTATVRPATPIRTISIANSPRRSTFVAPPSESGLDFAFLDASTGPIPGTRFDPELSFRHMKRVLVPAEVGIYCSHLRCWQALLDSGARQMIVLEDDVVVDWAFLARIAAFDWSDAGVDYLKLFGRYPAKFRIARWHFPMRDRHLVQYTTALLGGQAYLVTRRAAQRFVDRFGSVVSRPVDVEMDRPWSTGIPVMGLIPNGVMELSIPTSIQHRVANRSGTPVEIARYYGTRVVEHANARLYRLIGPRAKLRP